MRPLTSDRAESIRDVAILGDFLLLNFSMLAVYFLLKMVNVPAVTFPFKIYLVVSNLCYVPCISIFKVILHYRIVRPEQIVGRLLGTVTLHIVVFLTALALIKVGNFSRIYLLSFYLLFLPLLVGWRLTLRHIVKLVRKHGKNVRTVVLVGGGDNMAELYQVLSDVTYGYRVKKVFFAKDGVEGDTLSESFCRAEMQRLKEWLSENEVQELYCGLSAVYKDDILSIIRYCENNLIRFYSVPSLRNYVKRQLQLTLLGDVPVLSIRCEPLQKPMNRWMKRCFDLLCSSLFLMTLTFIFLT